MVRDLDAVIEIRKRQGGWPGEEGNLATDLVSRSRILSHLERTSVAKADLDKAIEIYERLAQGTAGKYFEADLKRAREEQKKVEESILRGEAKKGLYHGKPVGDWIQEMASNDRDARLGALKALREIGTEECIWNVVLSLKDADEAVRRRAAGYLETITASFRRSSRP